ncbi:hypothetical protein H6P81_016171 [Aristolochia fimbriata]|uniref:Integrase catalytic domain-containing protein n=1 Tax=Aristolochia fimbriata TaxID=158543 RepID=A0AAV7E8U5_ARIFI|nr:hypothetical protein H6P81_016171 [Aristolochia fimbriata]
MVGTFSTAPPEKKGEGPLVVCHKIQPTPLAEKVTLPLPKLEERSIVKKFPNSEQFSSTRSNEGFDPNTYRLIARAGGNFTKDQLHEKPPVALPVLTPEQEKLRKECHRITQARLGLGYQKEKPIKIYGAQEKPIKITRKASAYVHQVSVGQTSSKNKNGSNLMIICTLKAAIARARAYDSVMVNHISVTDDNQEDNEFILDEAPDTFEEGGQSIVDDLKKVDLGTKEDSRLTFLSALVSTVEEVEYMSLLHEYRKIFAWNYTEMPGLYPRVAVHKLAVHPSVGPDEELTAFCTPKGIFCYKVMSFRLKNADATYQRVMQNIFNDFLHKRVECYVDDLVVKTNERSDHLLDLRAAYFTKPPMLVTPIVDRSLLPYIAAQRKFVGALLAQCDEDNKEHSLYYLSRTLVGAELNYIPIEKTCLALIFAIQKLRHYLLAHLTNLISRADPLKYIMSQPIVYARLAKWALLLSKFKIHFVLQRAIKGQALANFMADHPVSAEWELIEEFPDKEIFLVEVLPPWEMYFDGPARWNGAGAGVPFVSPRRDLLLYSFVLTQNCSNNEAEYQVILLGLGMAVEVKLPQLNIYGDLALVIKHLTGEFQVKKLKLMPFWRHAGEFLAQIPKALLHYVPRSEKGPADALAGIVTSLAQFDERPSQVPICERLIGENLSQTFFATAHSQSTCESEFKFAEQHQGPITPKSDSDREYILAATDYFSKWAEAAAYREVKATTVANFIRTQIIYRYGVPRYIVTNNGTPFRNRAYNPATNGLAEAFNKTLCKILKKTIGDNKKSWDEKPNEALWAYRTSFRSPTQSTPYSLVYITEVVRPLEVQLLSLRIAIREGLTTEECVQLRLAELE